MSQNRKKEDFNSQFWKIWGVNNRVFEILDIFTIKPKKIDEKELNEYENLNRDKQADYKSYENFLGNDGLLSNEEYLKHLYREAKIFYELFSDYLFGDTEQIAFYMNQLNNINVNYKMFQMQKLDKEKYINLFAFQISLIIENMNYKNIDISYFDNSLKNKSIMPFFDKYREIKDCNNKKIIMTQKDLSIELSYTNSKIKELFEKNKIYIEDVTADTFNKEISKWKNHKEYPSFIKMIVIINAIKKGNNEEKIGIIFQLLIIRALLHIQKEFNIDETIKTKFLNQLDEYRKIIKNFYSSYTENEIFKLQNKYLIDFSNYLEQNESNLLSFLEKLKPKFYEFSKHNDGDKSINICLLNRKNIIKSFNKCISKEDYKNLLNEITDIPKNQPYSDYINNANNFLRFVISIKIKDKRLFNENYKYLDRSFGTLLSQSGVVKDLSEYIDILEGKLDLVDCIKLIGEHFKKLSTLR